MLRIFIVSFMILFFSSLSFGMTVGSPDIVQPEKTLIKREVVKRTLDRYDFDLHIKASLEAEIISKKKLTSSSEVTNAKIKGQNYAVKFSTNFGDVFEPYIKIGTSDIKVKWEQNGHDVTMIPKNELFWGVGAKVKVWEGKNNGIKLTLDTQYRKMDYDIDTMELNGSSGLASPINETFDITELQFSLLASKDVKLDFLMDNMYLTPYIGGTMSYTDIDVKFTRSTNGILYSTYNASDEDVFGLVLGCDVRPSLLSWYLLNFELRLVNETAFSLGGTIKF